MADCRASLGPLEGKYIKSGGKRGGRGKGGEGRGEGRRRGERNSGKNCNSRTIDLNQEQKCPNTCLTSHAVLAVATEMSSLLEMHGVIIEASYIVLSQSSVKLFSHNSIFAREFCKNVRKFSCFRT